MVCGLEFVVLGIVGGSCWLERSGSNQVIDKVQSLTCYRRVRGRSQKSRSAFKAYLLECDAPAKEWECTQDPRSGVQRGLRSVRVGLCRKTGLRQVLSAAFA